MRRLYPYGLLLLVLVGAGWARAYQLGTFSFWTDELYHVVAAQSLNETGTPYLPAYGDGRYTRALPVTYLTALGFKWFGNNEAAARAPFLAINILFLVLAFYVVRRWFNVRLALIVVIVLAFSPHELRMGREVRMYGLHQLFYFGAAAILFELLESGRGAKTGTELPGLARANRRRLRLLIAAGIVFLGLAGWVQLLTMNLVLAFAAYALLMAAAGNLRDGYATMFRSRYVKLLAIFALLGLAVWLVLPSVAAKLLAVARERPPWAPDISAYRLYSWFFLYYYPAFTFTYLLGAVLLIRDHGKPGWFVFCSFIPLLAVHVLLYTGRVEDRYLFYFLPYFFIAAGYVVELALRPLVRAIAGEWRTRSRAVAVVMCLAALPVPLLFTTTWLGESKSMLTYGYGPNWKTVAPVLKEVVAEDLVMSPWPLHVAYYTGEFPDYILRQKQPEDGEGPTGRLGSRTVPLRWLYDAGEFETLVATHDRVSVIMTEWAYNNDAYVDPAMREAIARLLVSMDHSGDPGVIILRKAK